MEKLLYSDAHCHSNPVKGLGAKRIARKFKSIGGWFIALVGLPPHHYGITESGVEAHLKAYRIAVEEAKRAREEGLETRVLVGFHPAEVDEYFRRGWSLRDIVELGYRLIDEIARLHREGLVDGIGEVGRQHYSTSPPRIIASQLITEYALEVARDNDMIVHLHLEQGGYATVESIRRLVDYTGIDYSRVFLHHVGYEEALYSSRYRLWYTVPCKKKTLHRLFREKPCHMLIESDFIDDPRRPGVSSYPWDIAVVVEEALRDNNVDEEYLYRVFVDNVVCAYRVNPP